MYSRILSRSLLVLVGGIFSFCTYTPEEDFYKEIEKVDPSNFTISLDSYDTQDTIFLEGPATFNYNLGSGSGTIQEVRIYLGSNLVQSNEQASGSFTISPSTGIYPIKIEFVSSSGTGSLADQAGGEIVQVWKEWIIDADVEVLPATPVITTSVVNGYAVITWTPYPNTKFVHYRFEIDNGPIHYITDPDVTTWVDSTYTGHSTRTYRVYTKNEVGTKGSAAQLNGNGNLAVHASFNLMDSTITVEVPKPVYYGTFKSYSIFEDGLEIGQLTDPNQSTYKFKSGNVGVNYSSDISVKSNLKPPAVIFGYGFHTVKTAVPMQKLSRAIQKFTYNNQMNSIIGFSGSGNDGKLFTISPTAFEITDSVEIFNGPGYHIPYNGVFAYYSNPKQLTQLNLLTHEEKSINAITSTFGSGPSSVRGSQPQIVSYGWFGPGPGNSIIYYRRVYDMATNQQISTQQSNSAITYAISDDGNFVMNGSEIYQITGGSLSLVGTLSFTGSWVGFRQDVCEEILSQTGNSFYIYDANSLTLKRIMSGPAGSAFVTYDVATKCMIFNNTSVAKLYSVSIDTGNVKEFKVSLSGFTFINGTIVMNSREYIKLY